MTIGVLIARDVAVEKVGKDTRFMQKVVRLEAKLLQAFAGVLAFGLYYALASHPALAATAIACGDPNAVGGLPWEGPLCKVQASLTGPVAMTISICAIFAAGAALVFGEEMSGFVKRLLAIVVAVAFLISGAGIVKALFGALVN